MRQKQRTKKEEQDLLRNLRKAEDETNALKQAINYTNDPLMLENLIYELKASELRYRHVLGLIRNQHNETRTFSATTESYTNETSQ